MRKKEKQSIEPFYFSGIYQIQSKCKPERVYIGSACSLAGRKESHFSSLRSGSHNNGRLQNHFNKYGQEDLVFTILKCVQETELIEAEQFFIDEVNPFFNIAKIAERPLQGRVVSRETCEKISNYRRTHPLTPKQRAVLDKINARGENSFKGRKHKPESIEKMRQSKLGKKASIETRRKLSEANKGEGNGFYGRKHSKKTRDNMSKVWHDTHKDLPQFKKGKVVLQYSMDGDLLKEWPSGAEAARKTDIGVHAIRSCLKGKSKTSGGYRWEYKNNS